MILCQSKLARTVSCQVLKISTDGDSTTSLSNVFPCLVTLTVKKVFSAVHIEPLCFSTCLLPLAKSLGNWKEPGSIFFTSSHQIFMNNYKIPLNFPFSRPRSLRFSLYERHSAPWYLYISITTCCSAGIIYNFIELCSPCVNCLTNFFGILVPLKIKKMLLIIVSDSMDQPFIIQEPDHQHLYSQRSTNGTYSLIREAFRISEKTKPGSQLETFHRNRNKKNT